MSRIQIHKLLFVGLAAALLPGLVACSQDAAPQQPGQDQVAIAHRTEPKPAEPLPEPPEPPEPAEDTVAAITPSFSDLILDKQAQNADTVGWLRVPGTDIDQVVLQNPPDKDNNYYLNLSFDGLPDKNGTFCADYRARFGPNGRENLSRNTAIYGHSWDDNPDGDLFAQLKRYKNPDFAKAHPYLFFSTDSEDMVWEVFAVFDSSVRLPYISPEMGNSYFFDMLELVYASSLYSYDIAISPEDKLLTLSTCTFSVFGHPELPGFNDYRFAIMARLVDPEEPIKAQAMFALNPDPVPPDAITDMLDNGAIRSYTYTTEMMKK